MIRRPSFGIRDFLASEAGGAVLLMASAALAMLFANLSEVTEHLYHAFVHAGVGPTLSPMLGRMTVHLWVNDGLMAIFFLLVGLEIKREMVDGELSTWEQRRLPFIAAAAGMVVPACIFLFCVARQPQLTGGWAIPAATDIAFAIGVLALLGRRAPTSLKLLLTAIAIADDMGAVAIIAIFYTQSIDMAALACVGGMLIAMWGLNRIGIRAVSPYLVAFVVLWYFTLLSGVHATIAGVLAAMFVPIRASAKSPDAGDSPLHRLERAVHPWSAYLIVPLFGFVNAGVRLDGAALGAVLTPLPLGVGAGLFLGKQIGIFSAIWLADRWRIADRPAGASWVQIYGMSLLCGIGFTMSLFISGLAFPGNPQLAEQAKMGILLGSLLSALVGFGVLRGARQADPA